MELSWQTSTATTVIDPITDYRLSRDATAYPEPVESLWWSAILLLRDISIDELVRRSDLQSPGNLIVPNVYDADERSAVPTEQPVTLFARAPLLKLANTVGNDLGVASVCLGGIIRREHLRPEPEPAPGPGHTPPPIRCPKGSAVMAVIDDGIAFANNLFRDGLTSTRIQLAYIMAAAHRHGGKGKPGETQGLTLDKSRIDRLLNECTSLGLLDEETFYARAGLFDLFGGHFSPVAHRRSHGTHVAALAAGYEIDAAPRTRPIICASLPPRVTQDTSGQNLYPSLLLALKRLRREALRFRMPGGKRPPVVYNFSYGTLDGPHDGTGRIPRLFQRLVGGDQTQVSRMVLPAGNGNLSRTHALADFAKTDRVTLDLRVVPDDRTASYVELWMPDGGSGKPDYVDVRVTPPGGPQSPPVRANSGESVSLVDHEGQEVGRLSCGRESGPGSRGVIVLSVNPTASLAQKAKLAPAGRWRIVIGKRSIAAGEAVEVWVRRDDTLPGFPPFGRQAHFDNASYRRFDGLGYPLAVDPPGTDCPVRRAGTLSGIATGEAPLVIAGFTHSNSLLSDYSAAGPVESRDGPDAAARSDDSVVLTGVLSAGSRSGTMVRLSGTSVAAPRVARFTADAMAKGATGDRVWLRSAVEHQPAPLPGPSPGPTRCGAGRLAIAVDFGPPE
ncbi:hypothetical protein [Thalassobaculum sp.]|uniref:hypothetical protein n=1 Tax=Thalassobaculum sp. TaxID=2022740 RepID=UPI0032ECAF90